MAPWHWEKHAFKAMNTQIYVWLFSSAANSKEILDDVQALFSSIERRLSRFDPAGELTRLNNTDGDFVAGPTLFDAFTSALWAAEATGGLFDPTILTDLERAGYDKSFDEIERNSLQTVSLHRARPGFFRLIHLNRAKSVISKPAGVKLDLGGIGKGWAVDRAADRLNGLGPFIINAGGDLYAHGLPPGEAGWKVTIPHPLDANRVVADFHVENRAVATSSIARRNWHRGGQLMHHLIDPRTAQPAQTDLLSVTVVGKRAALAEVFAKAALIIGSEEGVAYLESIPGIEGLLVTNDDRILQTTGLEQYLPVSG